MKSNTTNVTVNKSTWGKMQVLISEQSEAADG